MSVKINSFDFCGLIDLVNILDEKLEELDMISELKKRLEEGYEKHGKHKAVIVDTHPDNVSDTLFELDEEDLEALYKNRVKSIKEMQQSIKDIYDIEYVIEGENE